MRVILNQTRWDPEKEDNVNAKYLDIFKEHNGRINEVDANDVLGFLNHDIFYNFFPLI